MSDNTVNGAKGTTAAQYGTEENPVIVEVCKKRYPGSAQHIEDAQEPKGKFPKILTIARNNVENGKQADARRKDSLHGIPTKKKYDRDEYPPAMFEQGGTGASVKYVLASDNRGTGSSIGNQLQDFKNGTKVKIEVTDNCRKCVCTDINAEKNSNVDAILDIPSKNTQT